MTAIPTASGNNDFSLSGHTHIHMHAVPHLAFTFTYASYTHGLWMFLELRPLQVTPRRSRCATTTNPELIVACLPSNVRTLLFLSLYFSLSLSPLFFASRRLSSVSEIGLNYMLQHRFSSLNFVRDNCTMIWNRVSSFVTCD